MPSLELVTSIASRRKAYSSRVAVHSCAGKPVWDSNPPDVHGRRDVGLWLKSRLRKALSDVDVKYIDPSYLIRSVPAHSNDRVYCRMLSHGAVHGAFAGYTGVSVGLVGRRSITSSSTPLPLLPPWQHALRT